MKHYFKLVNFEFERLAKGYGGLLLFTILSQLTAVFLTTRRYMNDIQNLIFKQQFTEKAALENMGSISMLNITRTSLFNAPIALGITALLLYCLLIWYRDWFGKNTFIYRLLMLPVNRMSLFFSKLTVIFTAVLGLIGTQIALLLLENKLLTMLVPAIYRADMSLFEIINFSEILNILIPTTFINFLLSYGIGLLAVILLFTLILMERSFHIKGAVLGILYAVFSGFLLALPSILQVELRKFIFYPSELFLITTTIGILLIFLSIGISHYLINKKVTV